MSTPRVFLLRHGETEWSRNGRHTGRTDIPLTDRGRMLAKATGDVGRHLLGDTPSLVWCSPRSRARDTAELAGLTVDRIDERLTEWDYGDYEGITTEEIRETVPDWTIWTSPVPNGETAEQVAARADAVLADARATGVSVVLVGHGHFSRVLVSRWLARPATDGVHFAMDAAGWAVLGDERGAPRVDGLNYGPLA
ncbi:MAG: histidine phosphatase family protein [Pseudonocardiales bacterium]|nr:histidine phosphatase family protein [Pseudonocardiales bacterium]